MNSLPPKYNSFQDDGFIGPIRLYQPDEARELLHTIRTRNADRSKAIFDNEVNYDRHFDIPELAKHIVHPTIIDYLKPLLGGDILCWRTEFFPKFPGSDGTDWHQVKDYRYATGKPFLKPTKPIDDCRVDLTVWTAFTDATIENGCMKFIPGSHRRMYFDESKAQPQDPGQEYRSVASGTSFYGYNFNDLKVDPQWSPDSERVVSLEMQAGECVIFSARCVHGSQPNTTRRSTRFAITARYAPTQVSVYPGLDRFFAHGGHFELGNYGCVLVAGVDRFGHNRIRDADVHSNSFSAYANDYE